jgi:hypothetical protein
MRPKLEPNSRPKAKTERAARGMSFLYRLFAATPTMAPATPPYWHNSFVRRHA